jgi:hypothetical protein
MFCIECILLPVLQMVFQYEESLLFTLYHIFTLPKSKNFKQLILAYSYNLLIYKQFEFYTVLDTDRDKIVNLLVSAWGLIHFTT